MFQLKTLFVGAYIQVFVGWWPWLSVISIGPLIFTSLWSTWWSRRRPDSSGKTNVQHMKIDDVRISTAKWNTINSKLACAPSPVVYDLLKFLLVSSGLAREKIMVPRLIANSIWLICHDTGNSECTEFKILIVMSIISHVVWCLRAVPASALGEDQLLKPEGRELYHDGGNEAAQEGHEGVRNEVEPLKNKNGSRRQFKCQLYVVPKDI